VISRRIESESRSSWIRAERLAYSTTRSVFCASSCLLERIRMGYYYFL